MLIDLTGMEFQDKKKSASLIVHAALLTTDMGTEQLYRNPDLDN